MRISRLRQTDPRPPSRRWNHPQRPDNRGIDPRPFKGGGEARKLDGPVVRWIKVLQRTASTGSEMTTRRIGAFRP